MTEETNNISTGNPVAQEASNEAETNTTLNESTSEQVPSEPSEPEISEIEIKARALGWRPQTEYSGSNYVDPDEYVRRQPLFERIDRQKRDIEETRQIAKQSMDALIALRTELYNNQIRAVEAQKLQAVEEGDTRKYQQIEAHVQGIKAQIQNDPIINRPPMPSPISGEVLSFADRNSNWYNESSMENRKMKAAADAIDSYLYKQAAIDQGITTEQLKAGIAPNIDAKQHLAEVEKRVKQEFKHRFANQSRQEGSAVGKSTTSTTNNVSKQGSILVSKMTPQQLKFAQYCERTSNGKHTLESYAKELEALGRLGK